MPSPNAVSIPRLPIKDDGLVMMAKLYAFLLSMGASCMKIASYLTYTNPSLYIEHNYTDSLIT